MVSISATCALPSGAAGASRTPASQRARSTWSRLRAGVPPGRSLN